jgi:glycosyltransferase involved in cell wall biosynthesis
VIVVSNYTADIIAEKYLVDRRKIRVVHNAFSSVNGNNHHRRIFKDTTILFLGRITLQKGPDYFLEVARRVLERVKNVHFIMAGSGDMETGILHKSAYHKLGTKFLFSGFLNRDEVETILASTDIFVLPSVSEPFGIAPLEAMSHGAVAIMSKKAGVAEIVQNAYKVDFWDIEKMVSIIVDLVSNPDKRKEMSERGRNEVMALKWNEAGRKISDVYNQLQGVQKCLI